MADDTPNNSERENTAFRALVVAAFRHDDCDGDANLNASDKPELRLSEDDLRALNALGDDLVDRILAGESIAVSDSKPQSSPVSGHLVAMNRGGDLTDEARKEMERKIQESKKKSSEESAS